jgi:hypothetical protein
MDAIQFVQRYSDYVEEISSVVKSEYSDIIDYLRGLDPHDLVRPASYFSHENHARGLVWSLFMKEVKKFHV